jgi:nucleoid-associated protein YgaU
MSSVFALRLSSARFLELMDLDHPVQVRRLFTTLADGQRKAIFDFCFREGPDSDWQPVGQVHWDSLPASPAGEPTLELSLIPGREDGLLLRLKERSSGATRSYSVRLPALRRSPSLARAASAAPVVPVTPAAARAEPAAAHPVPLAPAAPARRPFRKWVAVAAVAGAAALAGAAFALFRFTPLRELLPAGQAASSGTGGTVQRPAPSAVKAPEPQSARAQPARVLPASPQPAPVQEGPDLSHRVQWGDTLWRITERYYGNPYLYDLLAGENALADPDLLIPGTELRLPSRIDDQDRKQ